VPTGPSDRAELRGLCARTVGFHNAFLSGYRSFLLAELADGMPARELAIVRLREIVYPDPVVRAAAVRLVGAGPIGAVARDIVRLIDQAAATKPESA
jgi:hypothetical protein